MTDMLTIIRGLCAPPAERAAFEAWIEREDAIDFLRTNAEAEDLILFASFPHLFVHAVGVAAERVNPMDVEDLLGWNFNAHDGSWGVCYRFSPPDIWVNPPLSSTATKTLEHGTKFVFHREFEGLIGEKRYIEILQEFLHIFGLHFVAERNAYCRLDDRGEYDDVIRILHAPRDGDFEGTLVLCLRSVLDEWMTLTDSVVVQTFDITRFNSESFSRWAHPADPKRTVEEDMMFDSVLQSGTGSYRRGVQIVRSPLAKQDLVDREDPRTRQEAREYASFLAYDFKHGAIAEISTVPGQTANYFQESDLPFEMSPAFFRAEVLLKYKTDRDRYKVGDRSLSCRGAWALKTFDVNEHSQVHTYIVYLRHLPYEEQIYWKAFNEAPKGGLSKRAIRTDFEGRWYQDYDPLPSLRSCLVEWVRRQVPWWTPRNKDLIEQVHYPVSSAADEWAEELLRLDQLVVEGFEEKRLRSLATELGRAPAKELRSLKLVEECLMGMGLEEERARQVTRPMFVLHDLRSKVKGHASGREAAEIKRNVLATHRSYRNHFEALCAQIDEAVRAIDWALGDPSQRPE